MKKGIDAVTYYGAAGSTPTVKLPKVVRVDLSQTKTMSDATNRDSGGWREWKPGLKDASLEIEIIRSTADAAFVFFANALENNLAVALFLADEADGAGLDGDWHISGIADNQNLEEATKIVVTAVPAGRMSRIAHEESSSSASDSASGSEESSSSGGE